MTRKVKMLIGGGLILTIFGGFVYSVVDEGVGAFQYYHTLEEYQSAKSRAEVKSNQGLRLNGSVVAGTIQRDLDKMQITFKMTDGKNVLPVVLTRIDVSDLFKDGASVVVEGKMRPDGIFVAEQLMAKCPTKYEAAEKKAATNS